MKQKPQTQENGTELKVSLRDSGLNLEVRRLSRINNSIVEFEEENTEKSSKE